MSTKSDKILEPNLRDKLIKSGLAILHEKGLQGLTLRACAAHCGVSHAAPAHHFQGLRGLLNGIAASGFEELNTFMIEARNLRSDDPREQIVGICEGYLEFAKARSALFTLMFNSGQELDMDGSLSVASAKAYETLSSACRPFETGDGVEELTETLVWSLVHGLASLQVGGRFRMPNLECEPPPIGDLLSGLSLRHR